MSQTGALIESILNVYKSTAKYPRIRGNTTCYFYKDLSNKHNGEPMFVLGPTWKLSILYMAIVNTGVGIGIDHLNHDSWMFHFLYIGMIFWNIVSIYLVVLNPGLAPRDPAIHQSRYL